MCHYIISISGLLKVYQAQEPDGSRRGAGPEPLFEVIDQSFDIKYLSIKSKISWVFYKYFFMLQLNCTLRLRFKMR